MPRKKAKKKSRIKAFLNFTVLLARVAAHLIWILGSFALIAIGAAEHNWSMVGFAIFLLILYIPFNEKWRKWILRK